jgi:hypothetical protein
MRIEVGDQFNTGGLVQDARLDQIEDTRTGDIFIRASGYLVNPVTEETQQITVYLAPAELLILNTFLSKMKEKLWDKGYNVAKAEEVLNAIIVDGAKDGTIGQAVNQLLENVDLDELMDDDDSV